MGKGTRASAAPSATPSARPWFTPVFMTNTFPGSVARHDITVRREASGVALLTVSTPGSTHLRNESNTRLDRAQALLLVDALLVALSEPPPVVHDRSAEVTVVVGTGDLRHEVTVGRPLYAGVAWLSVGTPRQEQRPGGVIETTPLGLSTSTQLSADNAALLANALRDAVA